MTVSLEEKLHRRLELAQRKLQLARQALRGGFKATALKILSARNEGELRFHALGLRKPGDSVWRPARNKKAPPKRGRAAKRASRR